MLSTLCIMLRVLRERSCLLTILIYHIFNTFKWILLKYFKAKNTANPLAEREGLPSL